MIQAFHLPSRVEIGNMKFTKIWYGHTFQGRNFSVEIYAEDSTCPYARAYIGSTQFKLRTREEWNKFLRVFQKLTGEQS